MSDAPGNSGPLAPLGPRGSLATSGDLARRGLDLIAAVLAQRSWLAATGALPLTLSYSSPDGRSIPLVPRGNLVPAPLAGRVLTVPSHASYYPPDGSQPREQAEVVLLLGEHARAERNRVLCRLELHATPESVGLTFAIDPDFHATVAVTEPPSVTPLTTRIDLGAILRPGDVERVLRETSAEDANLLAETHRFPDRYPGACALSIAGHGAMAAVGNRDGVIQIWDLATGRPVRTLTGPRASIVQIGWSPDDERLLASWEDGSASLWEVATGTELGRYPGPSKSRGPNGFAFAPDGCFAMACAHDWCEDGKLYPEGDWMSGWPQGRVELRSADGSRELASGPIGHEYAAVAFRDGGSRLVVMDPEVRLFETAEMKRLAHWPAGEIFWTGCWLSSDGRYFLEQGECDAPDEPRCQIYLYDLDRIGLATGQSSGKSWFGASSHAAVTPAWACSLAWDMERTRFLVGDIKGRISLRRAADLSLIAVQASSDSPIRAVTASRDGRVGMSASEDGIVRRWRLPP